MKKLDMREWDIIPADSEESRELALSLCTGVFAYQMNGSSEEPEEGAPYLVTHNPALPVLGISPAIDMELAMAAEEFDGKGGKRVSLKEILETYRRELGEASARLGVYMVNGMRGVHSDLSVARYFVAAGLAGGGYRLMGAELNRGEIVRAVFSPKQRNIDVFRGLESMPEFSYRLGERREINIG